MPSSPAVPGQPGRHHHLVGPGPVEDEVLLAVEHPAVAVGHGGGGDVGRVPRSPPPRPRPPSPRCPSAATAPRKRWRWARSPAATQGGDELAGRGQEGRRGTAPGRAARTPRPAPRSRDRCRRRPRGRSAPASRARPSGSTVPRRPCAVLDDGPDERDRALALEDGADRRLQLPLVVGQFEIHVTPRPDYDAAAATTRESTATAPRCCTTTGLRSSSTSRSPQAAARRATARTTSTRALTSALALAPGPGQQGVAAQRPRPSPRRRGGRGARGGRSRPSGPRRRRRRCPRARRDRNTGSWVTPTIISTPPTTCCWIWTPSIRALRVALQGPGHELGVDGRGLADAWPRPGGRDRRRTCGGSRARRSS